MTQQLLLDLLPAPPPTLDNFIVGDNAAVLDALRHCSPGRAIYLWGPPGAGRSHLLRALGASSGALYVADPDAAALHTSAAATARLIAVDDVHRLGEAGLAALFSLYNRWRAQASGPQAFALVLAADRAPMAMTLREDLRTRLGWDLVFRLQPLSDDDRARALAAQADERGLRLAPEVIQWVLTRYSRDMRQLAALLHALDRYSLEKQRAITLPLLKELLAASSPASPDSADA